jgi:DNA-3-methyladenine glycosylase
MILVRVLPDGTRLAARIVETEAYGETDPASHSFRGPTERNAVMFGPAGRLYVYFTYGMHFCANVVTGRRGEGSAVLLRAAEPLEGVDAMRALRRIDDARLLCAGPGRLCQALGIDRGDSGEDLLRGERVWLERAARPEAISVGPRVGIRHAVDRPWRFWVTGDPFVSRARPGPAPRGDRPRPAQRR